MPPRGRPVVWRAATWVRSKTRASWCWGAGGGARNGFGRAGGGGAWGGFFLRSVFGGGGGGGALGGLLLHSVLAVEAGTGALLGLVDAKVWNRDAGAAAPRRGRATAEKESQRWLDGAAHAGAVLASAASITVVSDREGD